MVQDTSPVLHGPGLEGLSSQAHVSTWSEPAENPGDTGDSLPSAVFFNEVLWGPRSPGPGVRRKQTRPNSVPSLFFPQNSSFSTNLYLKVLWTISSRSNPLTLRPPC